ncbi:MAG: hypothetical protein M3Q06_15120 [Bacteroidota bacterium]|nr:hypothetical protein [Bacteroidota bacterium]
MKQPLTIAHKEQLDEIKKNLALVGAKESNFIKIELLFYNALSVARAYGDDTDENALLAALKQLQAREYQQTKVLFKKSEQREKVIRRFISSLKTVLSAAIKNVYLQPQFT